MFVVTGTPGAHSVRSEMFVVTDVLSDHSVRTERLLTSNWSH